MPDYDLARNSILMQLADTGAHVGIFTDTDSSTLSLSELTRRQGGGPEGTMRGSVRAGDVNYIATSVEHPLYRIFFKYRLAFQFPGRNVLAASRLSRVLAPCADSQ